MYNQLKALENRSFQISFQILQRIQFKEFKFERVLNFENYGTSLCKNLLNLFHIIRDPRSSRDLELQNNSIEKSSKFQALN